MRKYCIVGNLKRECVEEYRERHKRLHLEAYKGILQIIRDSGVQEECVFMNGSQIIIYFEAEDLNEAYQRQGKSEMIQKWNEEMKPMFADDYEFNEEDHQLPVLEKVFDLSEQLEGDLRS